MALAYWIAPPHRLVVVRCHDVVTEVDARTLMEALAADPRFAPDFRELIDERTVTDIKMSPMAFRDVGAINPFGRGAKRAVVAPADHVFGMARKWQIIRPPSPDELQIFRELEPALGWLGITEADIPDSEADFVVPN